MSNSATSIDSFVQVQPEHTEPSLTNVENLRNITLESTTNADIQNWLDSVVSTPSEIPQDRSSRQDYTPQDELPHHAPIFSLSARRARPELPKLIIVQSYPAQSLASVTSRASFTLPSSATHQLRKYKKQLWKDYKRAITSPIEGTRYGTEESWKCAIVGIGDDRSGEQTTKNASSSKPPASVAPTLKEPDQALRRPLPVSFWNDENPEYRRLQAVGAQWREQARRDPEMHTSVTMTSLNWQTDALAELSIEG